MSEYEIKIDDKKMESCPVCGGKKINGPGHKSASNGAVICLTYTCPKCKYTQYVHTGDNLFLKSMKIKPTMF